MNQHPVLQTRRFSTKLDDPEWKLKLQKHKNIEFNFTNQEVMSDDESDRNSDEEAVYQQMGLINLKDM